MDREGTSVPTASLKQMYQPNTCSQYGRWEVSGETAACAATSHVQLYRLKHARPHGAAESHSLRPGAFSFISTHHISLSSLNMNHLLNLEFGGQKHRTAAREEVVSASPFC